MAPPVEGGANGGGGGGRRPHAIKITTGVPIGAQACSPPKPFKQPSLLPAGNGLVPQMSKGSVSSLASGATGSSVLVSALPPPISRGLSLRTGLRASAASAHRRAPDAPLRGPARLRTVDEGACVC